MRFISLQEHMNSSTVPWLRFAIIVAMSGWLAGCATFSSKDDDSDEDGKVVDIEVDPTLIRANQDGDDITMEHFNAEEVFEQGYYAFQGRRYEEAAEKYGIIIEYFQDSRFFLPALYNGGLSYEELDQWQDAADAFTLILEEFPESDEATNAEFRLAKAHHELGNYRAVVDQLTELLLREDLEHFDRVEAHVRRGQALLELEEWEDAEYSFDNILKSNREVPRTERLAMDHRFMVLANFGVGKANHGRMNGVALILPPDRMKDDLETKAEYHQAAQVAYIRALQEHHPHWSVAAGYMIGRLYQDFYMDIFTAEIPDDLTEEELAYYFEELRTAIQVLMNRAMSVYERNLSFSRRIAARNTEAEQWVDATALHLERMRAFIEDPLVQKRAEKLVIEGGDIEELWDTGYYARQHVDSALEDAIEEALEASEDMDSDDMARAPR